MTNGSPKWRRRRADRPAEIVAAALVEFAAKGFANARLGEIARAAGITKPALYRYFETKEALFRAVAQTVMAPNIDAIATAIAAGDAPLRDLLPKLLAQVAQTAVGGALPAAIRLVIGEARTFPDLAPIWHDTVVAPMLGALAGLIARGQSRGEIGPGEPRLLAFSLAGPMLMGMLFREVFADVASETVDLEALARQHARLFLAGAANPDRSGESP